jgi:hypothetical protein
MNSRHQPSHLSLFFLCFIFNASCLLFSGCKPSPKFSPNDCIMPTASNSPQDILKVIGRDDRHYKVFTYFLSNGKLILAKDYQTRICAEIDSAYVRVPCPKADGTFSPDEYLSKKRTAGTQGSKQ